MIKTSPPKSISVLRIAVMVATALTVSITVQSKTCEDIFKKAIELTLINQRWMPALETEYRKLREAWLLNETASTASHGMDKTLYDVWKKDPARVEPLFQLGFQLVEPSSSDPVGRIKFPASAAEYFLAVQASQGETPVFKIASYSANRWYALDEVPPDQAAISTDSDMQFEHFMEALASGYATQALSSTSIGFVHDAAHLTDLRTPGLFAALQKFAQDFRAKGYDKASIFKRRADVFMEISYVLKQEMYDSAPSYLVSSKTRIKTALDKLHVGTLGMSAKEIAKRLKKDAATTLNDIAYLTENFDNLFNRHGGAARDFYSIDNTLLTREAVTQYVQVMKARPTDGFYDKAVLATSRVEALESLEGIKRQIEVASEQLNRALAPQNSQVKSNKLVITELTNFIAFRVAQLETAIMQQRKLELSQIDIVQDSQLPLGVDSKTRRYFKSFQPPGSFHSEIFVGK